MTGVSYMIPFVAAGGLLIALGFLLAGYEIALNYADGTTGVAQNIVLNSSFANLPDLSTFDLANNATFTHGPLLTYLGALLFVLGGAAFGFLVPALAGYIAYAIADRPGIAPGFVMGAVAGVTNTGFIGGIVGGVLAGLIAHWIAMRKVPAWARGLMPVLVIPLGATLVSGLIMVVVLGKPLGALTTALTNGLNSLGDKPGLAILLGVVLGLMMAFDMGGPLNKTAYAFATAGLGAAATATNAPELKVMAAVMLAGMVPPIALALAHRGPSGAVHGAGAGERQGGLADGGLLHHRGARSRFAARRPAAGDPVDHVGQRRHRGPGRGVGRHPAGTARRDLRALRRRQHRRLPDLAGRRRAGGRGRGDRAEVRQADRRRRARPGCVRLSPAPI